jgi:hypothetical protein
MKKIITLLIGTFCLNANAQIITTVAGNGTAGFSGDGGQASSAEFNEPGDVIFDPSGNLYIADWNGNRIRKVNTSGVITTIAGTGTASFSGDGGQATAAGIYRPQKVILDGLGNIYVLDTYNNRVRKININGIITTIAGNGSTITSGDGGQATAAGIYQPTGLVFDASGNIFIAEYLGHRIRKVNTAGIISTIAGNGTPSYSGDGGPATAAKLNKPISLIMDASDNLYVTDYQNNRIRKINTAGIITTVAGNGTATFSGDGGQATAAGINSQFFEMDISGNIYLSDFLNNRIRKINTVGIISTIVGNGTAGFSGDGGQATLAKINNPAGIAFDNVGNLFIADWQNNRIRKVTNVGQMTGIKIEQSSFNNEQANIYPNPNNGNFTIETTEKQTIQIIDINGKIVLTQNISGKTNVDAYGLNKGIYNLSIIGVKGITNKKLVIVE